MGLAASPLVGLTSFVGLASLVGKTLPHEAHRAEPYETRSGDPTSEASL